MAADGGIFAFGDAGFYGSTGASASNAPIVGMAATDGKGYWLVAADGGIFAYGDAGLLRLAGREPARSGVVGMVASPDGQGYLDGHGQRRVLNYGDAKSTAA